ncbi:hypothetical protein NDU88_000541 [Pleurodeles waltl]|uniref:Uncharacterized protein n=1 Tax=Pleurodeles waltl TaxID=8319 RepID=A0AAV7SWP9_PLEWA|nr:hypothetical protein NDU88_000541 [Pleurodeles waltl]
MLDIPSQCTLHAVSFLAAGEQEKPVQPDVCCKPPRIPLPALRIYAIPWAVHNLGSYLSGHFKHIFLPMGAKWQ